MLGEAFLWISEGRRYGTGTGPLSVADARDLAEGALRGIGFDHDEARIVANHVIDAALCGYEYSGLAKTSTLWTANTLSCRADP